MKISHIVAAASFFVGCASPPLPPVQDASSDGYSAAGDDDRHFIARDSLSPDALEFSFKDDADEVRNEEPAGTGLRPGVTPKPRRLLSY